MVSSTNFLQELAKIISSSINRANRIGDDRANRIGDDERVCIEFKSEFPSDKNVMMRNEKILDGSVIRRLQHFLLPEGTAHTLTDVDFVTSAKLKK